MINSRTLASLCILCLIGILTIGASSLCSPPAMTEKDLRKIERLINQLGSDDFREREKAMVSLCSLGKEVLPAINDAQFNQDPEIRRRSLILLRQINVGAEPLCERGALVFFHGRNSIYSGEVYSVFMNGERFGNDDLTNLRGFDKLRQLSLTGSRITDEGLGRITHLADLVDLHIDGTSIHDLRPLSKLKNLTALQISGTKVTDEDLSVLKHLVNLEILDLQSTNITDRGVAHLQGLKKLQRLDLFGARKISNAGLVHLRALKELRSINVRGTKVTNEGYTDLKRHLPALDKRR